MSIYFRNTPVSAPSCLNLLGTTGIRLVSSVRTDIRIIITSRLKRVPDALKSVENFILGANEGILIAPVSLIPITGVYLLDHDVCHLHRNTGRQHSFHDRQPGSDPYRKGTGASIRKMISSTLRKYHQPTPDMKSLSSDCYNFLMNFTDCAASPKIQDNPLYQRYVIPVIKEIETGYQQDITAAQLSRSVFVSPQYLSRLFRRFMGCSVYEYVTMYRISRARELLLSRPDMKIQDVAGASGFSDASHFIAMFRKVTGTTPLDFRKMY